MIQSSKNPIKKGSFRLTQDLNLDLSDEVNSFQRTWAFQFGWTLPVALSKNDSLRNQVLPTLVEVNPTWASPVLS